MLEKRAVIDAENTPPEKKPCCGGSCHPSPTELQEHLTKRAADAVTEPPAEKKT